MTRIARSPRAVAELIHSEQYTLALDLETDSLNTVTCKIQVISVADESGNIGVLHIPDGKIPRPVRQSLGYAFRNGTEILTHNGVCFDLRILYHKLGILPTFQYDTLIGESVLNIENRRDIRRDIDSAMIRRLGESSKGTADHTLWGNNNLTREQIEYAVGDVQLMHRLARAQKTAAAKLGLDEALQKEQELGVLSCRMMCNGMHINTDTLRTHRDMLEIETHKLSETVTSIFGDINVRSPQQVKYALEQYIGTKLENTQEATLRMLAIDHPAVQTIVDLRKKLKTVTMYSEDWVRENVVDNRVYPNLWQLGTSTTRYSSSNPNLQQIPQTLRQVFGNAPNTAVVQSDYSSLELMIMAQVAQDTDLRDLLMSDEDFHAEVACLMFGKETVSKDERFKGKAGTFSWLFAGSARAVVRAAAKAGSRVPVRTAETWLNALDNRFPITASKHTAARNTVYRDDSWTTLIIKLPWGHKRLIRRVVRDKKTGRILDKATPSKLLNTPVQGTAAIGIKEGILEASKRGLMPYLDLQVHDELVCSSVPIANAEEIKNELADAMTTGMSRILTFMPPQVDAEINRSWVA